MAEREVTVVLSHSDIGKTIGGVLVAKSNYNSYTTFAEATKHLSSLGNYADPWFVEDSDEFNERLASTLVSAASMLDRLYHPHSKTDPGQAMQYPRAGMLNPDTLGTLSFEYDRDYSGVYGVFDAKVVPDYMKYAQAELALSLLSNNRFAGPKTNQASSIGLGKVAVSLSDNTNTMIPQSVRMWMTRVYSINRGYGVC